VFRRPSKHYEYWERSLSRLYNQEFLLLSELPSMVTVLETNYQIECSPSYTGNVHDVSSDIDFVYCMPGTLFVFHVVMCSNLMYAFFIDFPQRGFQRQ